MQYRQKLKDNNNYEVALFPLEYMYISQDEGGDYSHEGTFNIDFLGYNENGRVYHCPFYAPCTLRCVDIWDASNNVRVYQSVNKVHLANGQIDYLTICFAHDNNPIHNVGSVINQGELLGHTGDFGNVTGDHTHSCCGQGQYSGFTKRESGIYDLTNRVHYYDALFVNDTNIIEGYSHLWKFFNPSGFNNKKSKFNWILFNRIKTNHILLKKVK